MANDTASPSTGSNTGSVLSLPVLPLTTGVVLPNMVVTVALETEEARLAADAATPGPDGKDQLLLVPRLVDDEGNRRYSRVGVLATVENEGELPTGARALVVRATTRARIGAGLVSSGGALLVEAEPLEDVGLTARAIEAGRELRDAVADLFRRIGGRRLVEALDGVEGPSALADLAGWWPDLSLERKVRVLETVDVEARVELVLGWVRDAVAEADVAATIAKDVNDGLEARQREFLLRQQLAAIRKELGEGEDGDDLVATFRARLEVLAVTDETRSTIAAELDRFERLSPESAEHGWVRTWIETVFDLPWGEVTADDLDLEAARSTLDADHTGLDEVKDRIVEFLAVRKLHHERADAAADPTDGDDAVRPPARGGRGAILALAGPPGVGKTSLGESVARALGRTFVRVALGGVRDEAEIRGHRRTYVGARPGRIVRALTEAGSANPVVLLDEIDKLGAGWQGDPSAALLEVLDPAQNHTFRDHYLELDLDLSDVLFIATANAIENIPGPLLDRLELITVDGYTEDEKVAIATDHLLDRQRRANALRPDEIEVTAAAIRAIVTGYTREAGVRNLERRLGTVLRKAATRIAGGDVDGGIVIDVDDVADALGRPPFRDDDHERGRLPGVATGLAVTGAGGDVLFVEAAASDGEGLTLTGQLGDVMKESASIALSFLRANAASLGLAPADLDRRFHVHFPAGAIPKDGPSAGITMTTALVSLLTGRPMRADVAMTGEVTLSGRVLPIGGVKQKLLAAHRAGIRHVVLPARNGVDLDDVPDTVLADLEVHLVDDVRDVLAVALSAEEMAPVGA